MDFMSYPCIPVFLLESRRTLIIHVYADNYIYDYKDDSKDDENYNDNNINQICHIHHYYDDDDFYTGEKKYHDDDDWNCDNDSDNCDNDEKIEDGERRWNVAADGDIQIETTDNCAVHNGVENEQSEAEKEQTKEEDTEVNCIGDG